MVSRPPKRQQEVSDEFHMMVGYCIAAWAGVEHKLFSIFRHCVGGRVSQVTILYYRIPSLKTRFETADELVRSVLPQTEAGKHAHPDAKAWKSAMKGYDELLKVRGRIAHHPIDVQHPPPDVSDVRAPVTATTALIMSDTWMPAKPSFEISTSPYEKMRNKNKEDKRLKIDDLCDHRSEVGELENRLDKFYHETLTRHASPEPSRV
jgi:hypothetical protein